MILKDDFELLETLQDFGFSVIHSKIYLNLLRLGPTTAGPLVKKVGLHRQLVYSGLEQLESRNFVTQGVRNNRKIFSACRPEILLQKEKERLRKLQLSIPKMQQLIPVSNSNLHVETLTGKEEFVRRIFTLVDSAARTDGIIRMIADVRDVDVYATLGPYYEEYKKYLRAKKVKKKLIAPASSISKAYEEGFKKEVGSELKISKTSISSPIGICFTKEVLTFDIFSEDVVSVMIWNSTITKSFDSHFKTLWQAAIPWAKYINGKI